MDADAATSLESINVHLQKARGYSTASNASRGFARWLKQKLFVEVKTIALPIMDGAKIKQADWAILPPLVMATRLKERRPSLFFGPDPEMQREFWSKRGISDFKRCESAKPLLAFQIFLWLQMFIPADFQIFRFSDFQICRFSFSDFQIFRLSDAQTFRFSEFCVPIFIFSDAQIYVFSFRSEFLHSTLPHS